MPLKVNLLQIIELLFPGSRACVQAIDINNLWRLIHMDRKAICIAIGRNIRRQRQKLGVSEQAAANHLGITLRRLQKYENGDESPTCDELIEVATLLKCSVDDLCST
jgi:DNA-binding transcriptional regulator YiaG